MVHLPSPAHDDATDATAERSAPAASAKAAVRPDPRRLESPVAGSVPNDVPRPIGPERLRALREAIRNGTYPTDADVTVGLVRMFRTTEETDPDGAPKD